jgi:hypothetical protein
LTKKTFLPDPEILPDPVPTPLGLLKIKPFRKKYNFNSCWDNFFKQLLSELFFKSG